MTHPVLFWIMAVYTFFSVGGIIISEDPTKRFNNLIDSTVYGYTAYVLWGI